MKTLFIFFGMAAMLASVQPVLAQSGSQAVTSASLERTRPLSQETTATPRSPVYPKAIAGWNVPLGQRERTTGSVINRFIIHHTTNTGDESPYFKRRNERSSCPTWYVTATGDVI